MSEKENIFRKFAEAPLPPEAISYMESADGKSLRYAAWPTVIRIMAEEDPSLTFGVIEFDDHGVQVPQGQHGHPYQLLLNGHCFVATWITFMGKTASMWLPVMDVNYKPMSARAITSADINTAIMRCLVKTAAVRFGVGFELYEGTPDAATPAPRQITEEEAGFTTPEEMDAEQGIEPDDETGEVAFDLEERFGTDSSKNVPATAKAAAATPAPKPASVTEDKKLVAALDYKVKDLNIEALKGKPMRVLVDSSKSEKKSIRLLQSISAAGDALPEARAAKLILAAIQQGTVSFPAEAKGK